MKKIKLFFAFAILSCNILISQNIAINEVVASNGSIITDEDNDFEDFIEIYNFDSVAINLENFGLTDDENDLFQWVFPNITLQPGKYLLVWASKKDRTDPTKPLHTNFKISSSGETIILTHSNGTKLNQAPSIALEEGTSLGRLPNGSGGFVVFQKPTPNEANVTEIAPVNPPVFSHISGFYTSEVSLKITHSDPSVTILYTLDGSEPKPGNLGGVNYTYKNQYPNSVGQSFGPLLNSSFETLTYNETLILKDRTNEPNKLANISSTWGFVPTYFPNQEIKKATVVKARSLKNRVLSTVVTHTFFISSTNAFQSNLPIISFSLDEDQFFDYNKGIYVAGKDFDTWKLNNPNADESSGHGWIPAANWTNRDDANERPANLQYFRKNNLVLSQNIGVKIHGGYSRTFPIKSLRLYARSDYDLKSKFNFSFFGEGNDDSFKRVILRSGGTDQQDTNFRDPFFQRVVQHMNFDTQDYQPTVLYLNGEYWGIHNLREYYNKHYFERVYNVDEKDLDIVERNAQIAEGDNVHYINMRNYIINNDLSNTVHYDYVKTQMDVDNFTDYFIAEIFISNWDWPHNNIKYFRKKTTVYEPNARYGHDGRWRWVLQDVDYGFGGPHANTAFKTLTLPSFDMIDWTTNPEGNIFRVGGTWVNKILIKLLENETFRNDFINRFADQLNTGFLPSRILSIIDEVKNEVATEMLSHQARWKNVIPDWEGQIQVMRDFANQRPVFQREHIRKKFGITKNLNVKLYVSDKEHGFVKINSIDIKESTIGVSENPYPWSGVYFHDIPITLTAKPKKGYQFSHWSGANTSTNETITIKPKEHIYIKANFVPTTDLSEQLVYYWLIDSEVENNTPLTSLTSTYSIQDSTAVINFESAMVGYPFESTSPNWRESSMERRNEPTALNYFPLANKNISFKNSSVKGLQIKQPFEVAGNENILNFKFSTENFENIKLSFAALDEGAANKLIVEYFDGNNKWVSTGLINKTHPITSSYQVIEIDFSSILIAKNNSNFQCRILFEGTNMTEDAGKRVTFNNIAVVGTIIPGDYEENCPQENLVKPLFTQVPPICNGDTISPLPIISENGISGSWSPAQDKTQTVTYTFTPDSGQCNSSELVNMTITVKSCALNLEDNNTLVISLYKINNNTIRIKGIKSLEKVSLKMYSINGKVVLAKSFSTEKLNDIKIPSLSSGLYFIKVISNNKSFTKKIIIE